MKIRSGFVSNSSSSSFIIAVRPGINKCECCQRDDAFMVELLTKYLTTLTPASNKLHTMTTDEEVENYFGEEIRKWTGSKALAEKNLGIVTELLKDKKAVDDFFKIKKQLEILERPIAVHKEEKYMFDISLSLQERKKMLETRLAEHDKKVKELKEKISKMKACAKKGWKVYAFTMDNWATEAEKMIKKMMGEKDLIEVIESIHT